MYQYDYEHVDENGETSNWRLLYEVEPPSSGGRDEPPSGGVAMIMQIRREDGTVLATGAWADEGFGPVLVEALEKLCYSHWCDELESARDWEADHGMDERRERGAFGGVDDL